MIALPPRWEGFHLPTYPSAIAIRCISSFWAQDLASKRLSGLTSPAITDSWRSKRHWVAIISARPSVSWPVERSSATSATTSTATSSTLPTSGASSFRIRWMARRRFLTLYSGALRQNRRTSLIELTSGSDSTRQDSVCRSIRKRYNSTRCSSQGTDSMAFD